MSQKIILLAAQVALASAALASAVSEEYAGNEGSTEGTGSTAEGEPKARRGRPPGAANKPVDTTPGAAAASATPSGKTYEELQTLIRPVVEDGKGEEVKKVIAKYSATGLKDIPADKHAAFEKDIAALLY